MKTISKTIYDTPKVEIVEIKAERGFANSVQANSIEAWAWDEDELTF